MRHNKALHRFAFVTAAATFCLIVAGGLVTSTQSGLAVPDWPLSYGQLMPPMVGGILYEHSHRMVATVVGVLTTVLAVWMWRSDERKWMHILGFVALGAVIVQGVLGGLTVLFLLPTPISVSHATLAQTFFSLTAAIALFTSRWWNEDREYMPADEGKPSLLSLAALTTLAVYVQLILGALMRHTQSGLAVPDFPLAYGQLFPALSREALAQYNQQLIHDDIRIAADGPISASQILIHMAHRFWAVVVAILLLWTALRLRTVASQRLSLFSFILSGLLVLQIGLGALTVLSGKSVEAATAHVAAGALLLVSCVLLSLHVAKLYRVRLPGRSAALSPTEAPA